MKLSQRSKFLNRVVLVTLSLAFSAGLGKAQNAYEGKFTLPFEARWGTAVLPAGDYTFSMGSIAAAPYSLYLRGESKAVIIMAAAADQGVASDSSQLTLVEVNGKHAVQTLEAREVGLTFTYFVPKAETRLMGQARPPQLRVGVSSAGL